jgi:hypothetical protein
MADPLVEAMAAVPGLAHDICASHRPTSDDRCCSCTAGPQGGHVRFPCRLHDVASAALELVARRRQSAT